MIPQSFVLSLVSKAPGPTIPILQRRVRGTLTFRCDLSTWIPTFLWALVLRHCSLLFLVSILAYRIPRRAIPWSRTNIFRTSHPLPPRKFKSSLPLNHSLTFIFHCFYQGLTTKLGVSPRQTPHKQIKSIFYFAVLFADSDLEISLEGKSKDWSTYLNFEFSKKYNAIDMPKVAYESHYRYFSRLFIVSDTLFLETSSYPKTLIWD